MTGLVLDVERGHHEVHPGTRVMTWKRKEKDNQWWYDDLETGTIRTKVNGFCLDIEGDGELRVMPYKHGDPNQQWERDVAAGYIRNRVDRNKVLDVMNMNTEKGAKVGAWTANGGANQLWNFEGPGAVPAAKAAPVVQKRREFYIVSELNDKVLDVKGASTAAGAPVVMWTKNNPVSKNQLWYEDAHGHIRSVLTDFALDAQPGKDVVLQPSNEGPSQQWVVDGKLIKNKSTGEVFDIVRGNKDNGTGVCSWKHHGKPNQLWRIENV